MGFSACWLPKWQSGWKDTSGQSLDDVSSLGCLISDGQSSLWVEWSPSLVVEEAGAPRGKPAGQRVARAPGMPGMSAVPKAPGVTI